MAHPVGEPAFEDLTARARIRDAALRLFAQRGVDRTTIRDIAKDAGVSAGLVRHHFGSKEALREACDSYVLERSTRIKEQAVIDGQFIDPAFMASAHPAILLMKQYVARAMLDGSSAAASTFDDMVDLSEQWLARLGLGPFDDPRGCAAVLVALATSQMVMHEHLSRALGTDVLATAGHIRMTLATLEVLSQPLISPDLAAKARAAFDQLPPEGEP